MDDDDEEDADFDDGGGSDDDDDDSELSGMSDADDEVCLLSRSGKRHPVRACPNLALQALWYFSRDPLSTHLEAMGMPTSRQPTSWQQASEGCQPPAARCRSVVSALSTSVSCGGNIYDVPVNASRQGR